MKKYIFPAFLTFCAFVVLPLLGLAGVSGQKHDLSGGGGATFKADITSETEVCIFCHTPHGGISRDFNGYHVPLWNRSLNADATYSMYKSDTMVAKNDVPDVPTGVSLLCMSCHDGVSALNVLVNYGGYDPIIMEGFDQFGDVFVFGQPISANIGGLPSGAAANASRDLTNDHPISFSYDNALFIAAGGALNDPADAETAGLKLFDYGAKNNVLECATCHDPHVEGPEEVFLRFSNDNSAMCTTCHNK